MVRFHILINQSVINKVNSSKYLGVTITDNLGWSKHVSIITSKAHSVHGFLQRNLKQRSTTVKSKAHLAFVRPIFKYIRCSYLVPTYKL